jgi:Ni,Fe-hydrogenase I small subunit
MLPQDMATTTTFPQALLDIPTQFKWSCDSLQHTSNWQAIAHTNQNYTVIAVNNCPFHDTFATATVIIMDTH